ncbi:MAG: LssY C-terminal domain-containing protein [Deltaproteobacteria bacterium]|nr:LssY C-terminal domain-containing protein [Deltaproteobacteria bacterium]
MALAVVALAACASRPYEPAPIESIPFKSRAHTQREGDFRVTAAVPSPAEAEAIFGIPVYDRGMQPVWLEVENASRHRVRFAPVGMDRNYFPPHEVWYIHRKGFSKEGDKAMERYLDELSMPRIIPPGEARSGFVFTHASPGTKGFNVDLFGQGTQDGNFTFFIEVPGFVPDHAAVDFAGLYETDEIRDLNVKGLRAALAELPCCTSDESGSRQGLPIGLAVVGKGEDVLHALLRAGWFETVRPDDESEFAKAQFLFGRPPDAVFRIRRGGMYDRNELRLWLAPMRVGDEPVWLAQITHYIGQTTPIGRALFDPRLDRDIDDGRNYMLQIMWYSQGLEAFAWQSAGEVVPIDEMREDYKGAAYFTDGFRAVLWLSGDPVSLLETRHMAWDVPPYR